MQGTPYQPPIMIFVRGDDMAALQKISAEIESRVRAIPGTTDVDSDLESGQPELIARVNRPLAADLGFSVASVATQLRGMVEGVVPTKLREGDEEYDIRVRLAPEYRNDNAAVLRTPLYSPTGAVVRAGDIATFGPAVGPSNIDREQRRRQAKIGVDLADGYVLGDVTSQVQNVMSSVTMPANFEWGFAGDVEMMQESAQALLLALVLAIAFIYIVLASQFESFIEPFLIMLSLPLAIVGALLEAGLVRMRPIMMTTAAMVFGMLPLALALNDGGEIQAPMGRAIIGGVITSTLLTLVVVPVLYSYLARERRVAVTAPATTAASGSAAQPGTPAVAE
jgi:multidrug efflux pump subunit AcrB